MSISDERYVLLTTFRRTGAPVASPVWIASLGDRVAGFTTDHDAGKVKRIRHTPRVTVQACSVRGKPVAGASVVEAKAEIVMGADAEAVRRAVFRKYRIVSKLFVVASLFRKVLRRPEPPECAIRLTFPPAGS